MYDFTINFQYPWLLLLLVPAVGLALFFYFRISKKYRRNRNRIISLVFHLIVMTLCVFVLSGIGFSYDMPNSDNQVILLVDMSDSNGNVDSQRDSIVEDILYESREQYNVGVITFGYNQVLASEMSTDVDAVFRNYKNAELPDTSATDIAAAFTFAKQHITNPQTAKIVLISDGVETDGDAMSTVLSVASEGIRVDTVNIVRPETDEVEIIDVVVPDYNIAVGDPFNMTLRLKSSIEGDVSVTVFDNNEAKLTGNVALAKGVVDIPVQYEFENNGMHALRFEITNGYDTLNQNNTYYSYIQIAVCDKVLVIERNNGESENLVSMLKDGTGYTVDVVNVSDNDMPKTVDALRMYDEVVLMNISNADMPQGFDALLNSYVYNYGGGLFTVGGNNEADEANTYVKEDMEGTLYQQMLPVQAIDYTPPLGIVFLLDVSLSMYENNTSSGKPRIDLAKEAIASCIQNSLSDRDYCGIITLEDPATELCPVLSVPQMSRIIASMDKAQVSMFGTPYASSIEAAGSALMSLTQVEKRHMIIVSDGEPTDDGGEEEYGKVIDHYAALGVTISIVNVDASGQYDDAMTRAAEERGHGRYIKIEDIGMLTEKMREELEVDDIKGVHYETFTPTIREHTSVVSGVAQEDMPTLDGFYGTKIRENATSVLVGEYVPIYAQWKYGEGSVGSFMCDLNGTWSQNFIDSDTGGKIVRNIVSALFPTTNIRPDEINVQLTYKNYSTVMNIYTELNDGEVIEAVYKTNNSNGSEVVNPIEMDPTNGYSRATFAITDPGIHEVVVRRLDASGAVLATTSVYRILSYSAEYDVLEDYAGDIFLFDLATKGNGTYLSDYWQVYEGFEEVIRIKNDPRLTLCIIALIFFLLDIAVRKFKFKWPHELIREHKEKKARDK